MGNWKLTDQGELLRLVFTSSLTYVKISSDTELVIIYTSFCILQYYYHKSNGIRIRIRVKICRNIDQVSYTGCSFRRYNARFLV